MQYIVCLIGIALAVATVCFFKKKIENTKNRYIFILLSAAVIALSLEFFTFNFNSFEIEGKNYSQLSYFQQIKETTDKTIGENITITASQEANGNLYVVDVTNINTIVKNVDIAIEGDVKKSRVYFFVYG